MSLILLPSTETVFGKSWSWSRFALMASETDCPSDITRRATAVQGEATVSRIVYTACSSSAVQLQQLL